MDDLASLADLDVAYGQGYGIARPVAPWAPVSAAAVETCLASFVATLAEPSADSVRRAASHDRGLELLAGLLSQVADASEFAGALEPIGACLGADAVTLVTLDGRDGLASWSTADVPLAPRLRTLDAGPDASAVLERETVTQLLASDVRGPADERALLAELGLGSKLTVPVVLMGETIGLLELYSRRERPWSRFQIRHARIIAHQLGPAIERALPSAVTVTRAAGAHRR